MSNLEPVTLEMATPSPPEAPISTTYAAQVVRDAFASLAARIGLVWILIVAFFAVFAPFIANSEPYLVKIAGRWKMPLFTHLAWDDIMMLTTVVAVVFLWRLKRFSTGLKILVGGGGIFFASLIWWWVGPTRLFTNYAYYRDAAASGQVQFIINAPIPYSPMDYQEQLSLDPPSHQHWMGTELNGGDVASRLIHACRIALAMGFVASGIAVSIGVVVGGFMGYFSGVVDILGMRLIEIFEAIPTLFLMITLVAFFSGESYRLLMLMAVIGVTGWTGYARFVRADFLSLRQRDFVQAAHAAGLPLHSILFRHMLPNGVTAVVINLSFSIAGAIISESTLSFLDLGLKDQPSWGSMLSQALGPGGNFLWWMAIYPGAAIFLTVFAYVLLGESINDVLDPQRRR